MEPALPVPIDWMRLARTVEHFRSLGYGYIETPWVIPAWATNVTHAERTGTYHLTSTGINYGDLLGSAEQAFIALDALGELPKGRYVALTPCFRREQKLDHLHHKWFMKVELYDSFSSDNTTLERMLNTCSQWFDTLVGTKGAVKIERTSEGYDLTLGGIEIGSYGLRAAKVRGQILRWVYATGIAEPRFSQALAAWKGDTPNMED